MLPLCCLSFLFLLWLLLQPSVLFVCQSFTFRKTRQRPQQCADNLTQLEYDMTIIGAGASGLFASGASSMLGMKTLLIDNSNIGGDCSNSACVPSKSLRSIAQMGIEGSSMEVARSHAASVVEKVRNRENPEAMVERNPMLDFIFVDTCHFESRNHLTLGACKSYSYSRDLPEGQNVTIYSKNFLIATGASPVIPVHLEGSAKRAGLLYYTYRTLLLPSEHETIPESIWQLQNRAVETNSKLRIVIAGGGASACELGQILARLCGKHNQTTIHLVAPTLLRSEDVTLQNAALQVLSQEEGIVLHLRNKVEDILVNKQVKLSDDTLIPPADVIIFCLGRKPVLRSLRLENANVDWSEDLGVITNQNLQSTTAPNVYACGDCCSAVSSKSTTRTATHGAWTGYFASTNAKIPAILRVGGVRSCHPIVPRVIYTDPELSSVGMSLEECTRKYGLDGYNRLFLSEANTDRADMDSKLRNATIGFVEIRSLKISGKILGFTCCGPAASELANEMSLAIQNGLTVLDVAKSLHSYPSHGYLMHRVCLALAFNSIWGQLDVTGYIGKGIATAGRFVNKIFVTVKKGGMRKRRERKVLHEWEAEGVRESLLYADKGTEQQPEIPSKVVSFMDVYNQLATNINSASTEILSKDSFIDADLQSFMAWLSSAPSYKKLNTPDIHID